MKKFGTLNIFVQNIDHGYTLDEAVLTSTRDLCFRAKIRNNDYPYKPHFNYIKVGCMGCKSTWMCEHDDSDI